MTNLEGIIAYRIKKMERRTMNLSHTKAFYSVSILEQLIGHCRCNIILQRTSTILLSCGGGGGGLVARWSLGKLPVPGRLTVWMIENKDLLRLQQVRMAVIWIFFSSIFSLLFLPLSGRRPDID